MQKGHDFIGVSVTYFCHDGGGKFVMGKRSANARDEHGRWDIGAGGLEFGESVEHRLRTEVKEEYGADVLGHRFLGFRDALRTHDGRPTHWVGLDFAVRVDPAQVKNGEPHKFDEISWFTLDTLPDNMHSQWPIYIGQYEHILRSL